MLWMIPVVAMTILAAERKLVASLKFFYFLVGTNSDKFHSLFNKEFKSNDLCSDSLPSRIFPTSNAEFHVIWARDGHEQD